MKTRTEKLLDISEALSDGYDFAKLRFFIEGIENSKTDLSTNALILEKMDYVLDTFIKMIEFSKQCK